jgi:phospholipid/cholesterol/gamma-HCH transport system ATP-binding protein
MLSKSYVDQVVLKDFSMLVRSGEMKIVLGGSGSGKSTILKLVLGLVRPDSGHLWIGEHDITQLKEEKLMPIRAGIGMVFQAGALFDSLTVGENVSFRLREQRQLSDQEIRETASRVLGFVGLADAIDKMPSELSGGMQRRVALARALVGQPHIMLFDEPTAGLDPITGRTICELLMKLRDLQRVTSIFVTHDLKATRTMAQEYAREERDGAVSFQPRDAQTADNTRFVMIAKGRILMEGTHQDLEQTQDEYIREFLD